MLTKLNCLILALFITIGASAQTPDTIVIYEDVYITDTVWIPNRYDHLSEMASITSKANCLAHNRETDFTVNENTSLNLSSQLEMDSVVSDEGIKKGKRMQFGKPQISIRAGYTNFWPVVNPYYNFALFWGGHTGLDFKFPLEDSPLSLTIGYESRGTAFSNAEGFITSKSSEIGIPSLDERIEKYYSFLILVNYKIKRFELMGGVESRTSILETDSDFPDFEGYSWNNQALTIGCEYFLGQRFSILGKAYLGGMTRKTYPYGNRLISNISTSMSFKYYFLKSAKKKE